MLEAANRLPANPPLMLQETPVSYRITSQPRWAERIAA
jgi:hypothetical protein